MTVWTDEDSKTHHARCVNRIQCVRGGWGTRSLELSLKVPRLISYPISARRGATAKGRRHKSSLLLFAYKVGVNGLLTERERRVFLGGVREVGRRQRE